MKEFELINCEGTVLECKIDRLDNVSVHVYLCREEGYLKFRPLLKDLYKYLLGCITLEGVLKTSKNIKVNNIDKEADHIEIDHQHCMSRKITENSEQDLDLRNLAKLIFEIEKILFKNKKHVNLNVDRREGASINRSINSNLRSAINAIREMNSTKLGYILNEDHEYMQMNMYLFLAYMRDKFLENVCMGDTLLNYRRVRDRSEKVNSYTYKFIGNKSAKKWTLIFQIEDQDIVNILEYKN